MAGIKSLAARLDEQSRRIRQGMGYGIGGRSATRRRTSGESEYDRETRLRQEMQMQIREEYFAGRGEAGRQREEQMRTEQELAVEGWELAYDAEARKEMAGINDSIRKLRKDPRFSEEEKIWGERMLTEQMLGIPKGMSPPDPNKPQFPNGQDIGQSWMDNDGSTVTRTAEGEIKLIQRYDQGPEAAKMERQWAAEDAKMEWRRELAKEQVDTLDNKGEPSGSRYRTRAEIDAIMEAGEEEPREQSTGWRFMQPEQAPSVSAPMGPEQAPPVVEPPKELFRPGQEGTFLKDMERKYKGNIKEIPSDVLREMKRAYDAQEEKKSWAMKRRKTRRQMHGYER